MSVYISVKKKLPYVKNILEDIGYIYDPAGNDINPKNLKIEDSILILWNDNTYSYSYSSNDYDFDYDVSKYKIKDIILLCKNIQRKKLI